MTIKKLLILGGSHAEIPIIKVAKELNYFVITTGNKENDIGHKYADEYIKADFSNHEEILNLVKEHKIDVICPCANDFAALTCSYISEKLGLGNFDSYETSKIIHHKDKYRIFAKEHNISSPKAESFSNIEIALQSVNQFKLPIIIKPVDLSGGKGVSKIDESNISDIKIFINKAFTASKTQRIVIEEFIEGTNHGLSTILKEGKVIFSFCDNEHYYINKYLVSGASSPTIISQKAINKLIDESEKIAKLLELKDGIFHIQFIFSKNTPYIIEICRRPPGDLYIDFVKYATKIDFPKLILQGFLGNYNNIFDIPFSVLPITRHCIMANKNGKIRKIVIDKNIEPNIIEQCLWYKEGDEIVDFMTYKAGIIFLKYNSKEEMLEKTKIINELIKIEFEKGK